MGPLRYFLFVYVLGGLTFVPLLAITLLAFVFYTSGPPQDRANALKDDPAQIKRDGDEKLIFKSGTDDLAEKFHRKHDSDVAAGYFAVCREYVPGGVNGKPPEKLSPAGEVVANESPSVYQTMYRSIFDRSQRATIEPNKDGAGKNVKRANNIFYVVLRHGHLMLYDDIQQLEVRYVISLDYHNVDIYAGTDEPINEGELWQKRHAIRLQRKDPQVGDKSSSLPFFLFSENTSDKEDFYFAIIKNQRRNSDEIPEAEEFEVRHMVNLVQKLHSSEEHLATRWLNALIGRLFLAVYKTEDLEDFIRDKLMKKLSRVKKPTFITRLALQKMDMGTSGPFITNPRLRDLTVNGDCMVEADVDYNGNFRLEVGATARIDLGTRFKAREVELVLAITVKKVNGHALLRFKPPPSNRVWITFEKMPELELAVEPIVSSRQITYTLILRAIESRIREVLAESLVLPFWDDIPFLRTFGQKYRGGIWKREHAAPASVEVRTEDPEDEAEAGGSGTQTPESIHLTAKDDRNLSMPVLADTKKFGLDKKTATSLSDFNISSVKPPQTPPRLLRSSSFANVADPMIAASNVDIEATRNGLDGSKRDSASSFLKDLSSRSQTGSAAGSLAGSPPTEPSLAAAMKGRSDSVASRSSSEIPATASRLSVADDGTSTSSLTADSRYRDLPDEPVRRDPTQRPQSSQGEPRQRQTLVQAAKSLTAADRKQALASAQATAQKWGTIGWGVLARNRQQRAGGEQNSNNGTPAAPMGRGQPLPPPGQPLPRPLKQNTISGMASSMLTKRKPILPQRPSEKQHGSTDSLSNGTKATTKEKPPLPDRRRRQTSRSDLGQDDGEDEVMVVEAPVDSTPASPEAERKDLTKDDFFGHGEEEESAETVGLPSPSDQNVPESYDERPEYGHEQASEHSKIADDTPHTAVVTEPEVEVALNPAGTMHDNNNNNHIDEIPKDPTNIAQDDTPSKQPPKQPPDLPPRQDFSPPPSPTTSIKRKPLNRSATTDSVDGRPLSPQAAEVSSAERGLSYMEAASGNGGYNE